jgi:hypothetical protein
MRGHYRPDPRRVREENRGEQQQEVQQVNSKKEFKRIEQQGREFENSKRRDQNWKRGFNRTLGRTEQNSKKQFKS